MMEFAQQLQLFGEAILFRSGPARGGADLEDVFSRMRARSTYAWLLESGKDGRYTHLGYQPEWVLIGQDTGLLIRTPGKEEGDRETLLGGEPLTLLRQHIPHRKETVPRPAFAPFLGGVVGYFSYDLAYYLEPIRRKNRAEPAIPLYYLACVNRMLTLDRMTDTWFLSCRIEGEPAEAATLYEQAMEALMREWDMLFADRPCPTGRLQGGGGGWAKGGEVSPEDRQGGQSIRVQRAYSLSAAEFALAVGRVQDYIRAGDVFQVNLSLRGEQPLAADSWAVYRSLRKLNPSPYMAYLCFPEFAVVCGSPELLVEVGEGLVQTRPIAGTRKRGETEEQDRALEEELLSNEKERAEHVMLVDLERNDLGRVCQYGTVEVTQLMQVERYSHVMHLVSHVRGRLEPGRTLLDVLAAVFPGGTITGAPKVRTMQIIEELEPVSRGIYTGAIGWIGDNESMVLNIVIRTLLAHQGTVYVQSGAGIVIDSLPEREYKESLRKAEALWLAVEEAHREAEGERLRRK